MGFSTIEAYKELIRTGKKSPFSLVENVKKKQKSDLESEPETKEEIKKVNDKTDPDKNLKYSRGCDIDKDEFALELAQRLQVSISSFGATLNYFKTEADVCRNMPPEYKEIILEDILSLVDSWRIQESGQ